MSKVLRGATILAFTTLIAKVIGVLYRIPLTNIVGSGGIGLYQMIFPLYVLLLTISSGGLPVAISKVVSNRIANGDEAGAKRVLKLSIISLTSIGLVLAVMLFFLRNHIARWQGNEGAALGYGAIAPAIVFVCIIASFRGYFQGRQNMLPSSISQLTEQIVKLAAGIGLAFWLFPRGIEFAVFGALIGVSLSEVVTAFVLWMQYLHSNRRDIKRAALMKTVQAGCRRGHPIRVAQNHLLFLSSKHVGVAECCSSLKKEKEGRTFDKCGRQSAAPTNEQMHICNKATFNQQKSRTILKEIYLIALPVTLGSLVMPLMGLIDSIIVINLLSSTGTTTATATSYFGILTGPVGTMLNMPTVITLSFAIALLPKISECFTNKENPDKYISQCLKWCIILGFIATAFLAVFATPVLSLLYRGGLSQEELTLASNLLILGSISVVFVSILQVATSVLQGVGKAHRPAINLGIGAVFKVVLTLLLLPRIGIFGAMIATVVCYGITCLLDVISMKKLAPVTLDLKKSLFVPLLATAAFTALAITLKMLLSPKLNSILSLSISLFLSSIIFFTILIIFKSITKQEMSSLPIIKNIFKKIKT